MPLKVLDVLAAEARDLYGCDLALVRPDQYVAWRGNTVSDEAELLTRRTGGSRSGG